VNLPRALLRLLLGRRLPKTRGALAVPGVAGRVTVRRDRWGIPHIDAGTDADAWFGLGFCHGQDRAAQLEFYRRAAAGTLAELVGPDGLAVDRLSRRIGFRRSAVAQLPVLAPDARAVLDAYAAGVNAGITRGLPRKPHEFAVLGGRPGAWDAADVGAYLKLQALLISGNWDVELARLMILLADGPEAVAALDPAPANNGPLVDPRARPGEDVRAATDRDALVLSWKAAERLADDLTAFLKLAPGRAAGSNAWVLTGAKTASGRPLVANDPHVGPTLPAPWYLAHVRTPEWAVCGATTAGAPGFAAGHNGHIAWGSTAGLTDNTDLYVEEVGPDGASVRGPAGWERCEVREEVIKVRGKADVVERVLVTPRGPIVSPALEGVDAAPGWRPPTRPASPADLPRKGGGEAWAGSSPPPARPGPSPSPLRGRSAGEAGRVGGGAAGRYALSMRAVWLDPLPVRGLLDAARARTFDDFRRPFADWPMTPQHLVYADTAGAVGWQLCGQVPERKGNWGMVPARGSDPAAGWNGLIPFDRMPHSTTPAAGFFATANNPPLPEGEGPFLGYDWVNGYRAGAITDELQSRGGWDVAGCLALQTSRRSKPWDEIRDIVLSLPAADGDARRGLGLLRGWDGRAAADSAAASVYVFFLCELAVRAARAKAPNGWEWALGKGFGGLMPHTLFADRRFGHLVRLVREQPAGWFARPWPEVMADALATAVRRLEQVSVRQAEYARWGEVRTVTFEHLVFGKVPLLRTIFNRGPIPGGGDSNTPFQATVQPLDPLAPPAYTPTFRMAVEVGAWENSRFVVAIGQSGNPLSPHYSDLFDLWRAGDGVPIAWTEAEVASATVATLTLDPV
jgi:penicillin amidase